MKDKDEELSQGSHLPLVASFLCIQSLSAKVPMLQEAGVLHVRCTPPSTQGVLGLWVPCLLSPHLHRGESLSLPLTHRELGQAQTGARH